MERKTVRLSLNCQQRRKPLFLTCSYPRFPPLLLMAAVTQDVGSGSVPSSHLHFREGPAVEAESISFPSTVTVGTPAPAQPNSLISAPSFSASAKGLNGTGKSTLVGFSSTNRSSLLSSIVPVSYKSSSKFPGSQCFCQEFPNPSNREQKGNMGYGSEHGCTINLH